MFCQKGDALSQFLHGLIPLANRENEALLRRILELYPFFVQCFLIPGTAFERWLLICKPSKAAKVLKSGYRFVFYISVSFVALIVPTAFLLEFLWFQQSPFQTQKRNYYEYKYEWLSDYVAVRLPYKLLSTKYYREVTSFISSDSQREEFLGLSESFRVYFKLVLARLRVKSKLGSRVSEESLNLSSPDL